MRVQSSAARLSLVAALVALASFATGQQCTTPTDGTGTDSATSASATAQAASTIPDADGDGVPDYLDNCRLVPNRSQRETARHGVTCQGSVEVSSVNGSQEITFGTCSDDPSVKCLADRDCLLGDACDCDFNGDGRCNIDDYNQLLADYGGPGSSAGTDMNGDGVVDDLDYALFEPGFAAGVPGPGATHEQVVVQDSGGTYAAGGCWDRRQARRLQPSEGRSNGVDILDCSVPVDSIPGTWDLPGGFSLGVTYTEAMKEDKNNPTDKYIELSQGTVGACPDASFSISSKTHPRACDNHDLCGSSCGRTHVDCNLQFARDLFNTCEALTGSERNTCYAPCIQYAIAYATFINGTLILSPPREASLAPPSQFDYESDLNNCQCGAPVCETDADCLDTYSDQKISVCEKGYCVHTFSRDCPSTPCPDGYVCDQAHGLCTWDTSSYTDRRGTPPPICGDGVCQGPAETCTASGCPEDCGDPSVSYVPGFGRCELNQRCQLDRDCAQGACFRGQCQLLADGSVCDFPRYCQSGICSATSKTCVSSCTLDSECQTGVCSVLGTCIEPQPNGSPCDANTDCASGVCNFPTCIAANSVTPGGACTTGGACTSGNCVAGFCSGTCGDGYCTAVPDGETCFQSSCQADCGKCPSGTPGCTTDADCAGNLCGGGVCLDRASLDAGHTCLFNAECKSGDCVAGFCAGTCGDGICTVVPDGETTVSCPQDCGSLCGDLTCNGNESCSNCVVDCGLCPAYCGDGSCNGTELCGNSNSGLECNQDCGKCSNGHVCTASNDCSSGLCYAGFCCGKGGTGASCSGNSGCCSGICAFGKCV